MLILFLRRKGDTIMKAIIITISEVLFYIKKGNRCLSMRVLELIPRKRSVTSVMIYGRCKVPTITFRRSTVMSSALALLINRERYRLIPKKVFSNWISPEHTQPKHR